MSDTIWGTRKIKPLFSRSSHSDGLVQEYRAGGRIVVQLLSHVSLRIHELQHARLPCPSLSPGVWTSSCPLSWWCYLTTSSSAAPSSFCFQSFPAQGLFQWVGSSHQVAKVLEHGMTPVKWCITLLGLLYQSTTNWMAWKNTHTHTHTHTHIWSHSSGGQKSEIKRLAGPCSLWRD